MLFQNALVHGILVKRYKRFLANIKLDSGEVVVAHCTNSGSMLTCIEDGAEVYVSVVDNPKRKTGFTWEIIKIDNKWVGVNTSLPNVLAFDAILNNEIPKLAGYTKVKREVSFNDSRFDIYCEKQAEKCFVEVKNVTMKVGNVARFPDAVTTRGQKHLKTLVKAKAEGFRAVMLYIIQRMDVDSFGSAKDIDPNYADCLKKAVKAGVEVIAMQAEVTPEYIVLKKELPFTM